MRGAYYFVGMGLGSLLAGAVVDARGFVTLYRAGAAAMLAWAGAWAALLAIDGAAARAAARRRVGTTGANS